jgi:DNA-binding FadR family transcriptional regulator
MTVTLELPDELEAQPLPQTAVLARLLEWGVKRRQLRSPLLRDLSMMLERLAESPDATEVAAMRVTDQGQDRLEELLERNRDGTLTADERNEWAEYERLEHLVRAAKTAAMAKLKVK